MNLSKKLFYLLCAGLLFGSCVKDDKDDRENCRQGRITVSVKDKNYANISEIPGLTPTDENLPFFSFINEMALWCHKEGLGNSELRRVDLIAGQEHSHLLDTDFIPAGNYEVVLIGNETILGGLIQSDDIIRDLHPDHVEYEDIYIGIDDVEFPVQEDKTVWLYRTKGLLLIDFVNLPAEIIRADIMASGIYKTIDKVGYSGTTYAIKSFNLITSSGPKEFLLAPTVEDDESMLVIELYDNELNRVRLSNIPFKIMRNRITIVRPEYNQEGGEWELSVYIDGEWERIHDLKIEVAN